LEVLAHLRKHRRERPVEDRILHDAMDAAFEAYQDAESACRLDYVRDCLARLSQRGRELIRLRYEDDAGYQKIGATLDMKLEAVRKGLYRAKQQLENCVRSRIGQEATS